MAYWLRNVEVRALNIIERVLGAKWPEFNIFTALNRMTGFI